MNIMEKIESVVDVFMKSFLALMGILTFSNIVLRYFFNYSITWTEEMSRFLFVWLIFLGAIGALKDGNHLGFTSFVQGLPQTAKKICYLVSNVLMVACLGILSWGGFRMTKMTLRQVAPATGIPMASMYVIAVVMSVAMFLIVCHNLYKAFTEKDAIDKLVVLKESEQELD